MFTYIDVIKMRKKNQETKKMGIVTGHFSLFPLSLSSCNFPSFFSLQLTLLSDQRTEGPLVVNLNSLGAQLTQNRV